MSEDYLRLIAAQLHSQLLLTAAQEMFGISWFDLAPEKRNTIYLAVDRLERDGAVYLTPQQTAELAILPRAPGQEAPRQRNPIGMAPTPEKKDT